MGDLGNLGNFFKEGTGSGIANLDWLDVNEQEYREQSILPKQNLDVRPDLQALWARNDEAPTTYLIPNKTPVPSFPGAGDPHTMGDLSAVHGKLRARAEEIRKVARLAMMQSPNMDRVRDALVKRFDLETLRANRDVLASVVSERGLLGRLYVAASDFNCETGDRKPAQFTRRFAADAPFVVAKEACNGCLHATKNPTGGQTCSVFHKEIVMDVPYTEALAQAVEQTQKAKGKEVGASAAPPRERIRLAMLAPDGARAPFAGAYQGEGTVYVRPPVFVANAEQKLIQANDLLRKKQAEGVSAAKAAGVVAFLRREMLKGNTVDDLVNGLKLSFSSADLQETRATWEPIFKESGLYGHVYSTQDSFEDCREGADFLAKHNPGVRAMVAGSKCTGCIYNKMSRCLMYGKPLIKQASDIYTSETVDAVMMEHKTANRLPEWEAKQASNWGSEPREQLKTMHRVAFSRAPLPVTSYETRMSIVKGFYGNRQEVVNEPLMRPEVLWARRYMNEGLYGHKLALALKMKFDPRELVAASNDLRPVLAEQGLQGIYYVDPTVYADYGGGCDEAMRLHRSRLVKYAKVGPKCAGCTLQTRSGFCSKLNKELVREPPYVDKTAQQRAILASGDAMSNEAHDIITHEGLRHNIRAEYEVQQGGMQVEVDAPRAASVPFEMEFNNRKVGL